jgi:hypothetical protein
MGDEGDGTGDGGYYNSPAVSGNWLHQMDCAQEMPEVPDVEILMCGERLHHKMGIKVPVLLSLPSLDILLLVSSTTTKTLRRGLVAGSFPTTTCLTGRPS